MGVNSQDAEHEGYLEIPLDHYVVIGHTAIHKEFALYWGAFNFLSAIILFLIGLYTNWYSILLQRYWPYIALIALIVSGALYLKFRSKGKGKARKTNMQPTQNQNNNRLPTQNPQTKQRTRG
jgi:hypothetical protein